VDLLAVLVCLGCLAAAAPAADRRWGRETGYLLAVGFLAAAVTVLRHLPAVLSGQAPTVSLQWLPTAGIAFSLRLDALALLFALLVLGVGALVMTYCARYLSPGAGHGRLYALLTLFAVAMLGLVLAGDVVLLLVFWELTSVCSFLLIAGNGRGRRQATRALLVTAGGGLALLAGVVLMVTTAGTSELAVLLSEPQRVTASPWAPAIAALVILSAATKSALLPFHFWLPGAMVAVTPVSAYLHAATMVKAGIYLLARLSPLLSGTGPWDVLVPLGLATAVYGAAVALAQHDLKALLAYSTVSQLGFIVALLGVGTPKALGAALLHTLAHALFKAALFMLVGILDREAGSRDVRQLSGLRSVMPLTATAAALAGLSMAGVPPFAGFVSKEEAFAAFLAAPGPAAAGWAAALTATAAAALTAAYGLRIFLGAFGGPLLQPGLYEPARAFRAPAEVAAGAGLLLGLGVAGLDPLLDRVVLDSIGRDRGADLALWHGFTPALGLSAAALTGGVVLYLARGRVDRSLPSLLPHRGEELFDRGHAGLQSLGWAVSRPWASARPAAHVAGVLLAVLVVAAVAGGAGVSVPRTVAGAARLEDWVVVVTVAACLLGLMRARSRMAAICLAGLVGLAVAAWFLLLGAADLALTLILVETLTVVLAVLILRRLPARVRPSGRPRRLGAAALAVVVGAASATAVLLVSARPETSPSGSYVLREAERLTGGRNAVNTVLVDFRALDTLGEITVLAAVALALVLVLRPADEPAPSAGLVLRSTQRLLAPVLLTMSLVLLLQGHDHPGGGFIAGLVGGAALALGHLSGRRSVSVGERERLLLAGGLAIAVVTGLATLVLTGSFLATEVLPVAGTTVASSLAFDVGVYLLVTGLCATALRAFGGAR